MPRSKTPPLNFYQPSLGLLIKLGSIVGHTEEMLSADGHAYDKMALEQLLKDPEVQTWTKIGVNAGLFPLPRRGKR